MDPRTLIRSGITSDILGPQLVGAAPVCPSGFTLNESFSDPPDGTITDDGKVCQRELRNGTKLRIDNHPPPALVGP